MRRYRGGFGPSLHPVATYCAVVDFVAVQPIRWSKGQTTLYVPSVYTLAPVGPNRGLTAQTGDQSSLEWVVLWRCA